MKRYLFLLFAILCTCSLHAQLPSLGDSIGNTGAFGFAHKNEYGRYKYVADSLYFYQQAKNNLAYATGALTQLAADTNMRYGYLQVDGASRAYGFRRPMEAYKESSATLYTTGMATLGKFKVYGSFAFIKKWQDSLANNLTADVTTDAPYFYYTPKAGTYERQAYNLTAGGIYRATKKLDAGVALQYDYYWGTGSVDPRPASSLFMVKILPEVVYHINAATAAGVRAMAGKGDETTDIAYKNAMYNHSTLYPDRYFYLNYGYGREGVKDKSLGRAAYRYSGIGLSVNRQLSTGTLQANADYTQAFTTNYKPRADTGAAGILSTYLLNTYLATALWNHQGGRARSQLSVYAQHAAGSDRYMLINAKNYFFKQTTAGGNWLVMLPAHKRFTPEAGLGAAYSQYSKEDKMQGHALTAQKVSAGLSLGGYWQLKKDKCTAAIKPAITWPLKSTLLVPPTQVTSFTNTIAGGEYYYNGYKILSAEVYGNYVFAKLFRRTSAGIFSRVLWEKNSGNLHGPPVNYKLDGSSRTYVQCGFNVFL